MTVTHLLIGTFIWQGVDLGTVLMICVFVFIYTNTSGPIAWIYAQETTTDAGLGVSLNFLFGTILILSISTPYLMSSALHASGTFYLLAILSMIGFFFVLIWFKESMGLTEKEKKELYLPSDLKGGDGDDCFIEELYSEADSSHISELHSED